MNVHSQMTGLLLISALLLPNVAWCWDNDSYRSQANPSGYSGGYGNSRQTDYYSDSQNYYSGNQNRSSGNYGHDKPKETPQEYQYRKLGEYNQAKVDQQIETARQQAEYQQEKYRMDAEAQLRSLQK